MNRIPKKRYCRLQKQTGFILALSRKYALKKQKSQQYTAPQRNDTTDLHTNNNSVCNVMTCKQICSLIVRWTAHKKSITEEVYHNILILSSCRYYI